MSEASEAAPAAAPAVRLAGLRKVFGTGAGSVVAVDSVDLDVGDGEFFAMLGPSGSGKTTVLRMIAGFETPTAGRIHLGGRDVTTDPPFDRDVNTVFQDYALFPHMSVLDNVAYGLMVKGVGKSARRTQAREALATMRLAGMDDRRPGQLSGGQRQRVALARALVNHPKVLLLDEPLGALDLKLREQMQLELKSIQREVGVTFLFVTHDQDEALTMSDRIAVFNEGQVEQVGTPSEVYEHPATPFVAGFVGTSNLIADEAARTLLGEDGTFSVRPEKIALHLGGDASRAPGQVVADGEVHEVVYAGPSTRYVVRLDAGPELVALQQNTGPASDRAAAPRGSRVRLGFARENVYRVRGATREEGMR
ncbi:MAG TPA: ABC transporter ATP-binding protein [Actinomycetes bacterium]|nr:ABC transporter ATP-binding protein [Actinomycetes bacterium]